MQEGMTIGVLANKVGLTAEALRYYERLGLIAPSKRTAANYRLYDEEAALRLRFIRRAQNLGFSLNEITQLLSLSAYPDTDMGEVKALTEAKLQDIQTKIDDLVRMKEALEILNERCPGHGSTGSCPILAALLNDDD